MAAALLLGYRNRSIDSSSEALHGLHEAVVGADIIGTQTPRGARVRISFRACRGERIFVVPTLKQLFVLVLELDAQGQDHTEKAHEHSETAARDRTLGGDARPVLALCLAARHS